jgi:hypothetical protein
MTLTASCCRTAGVCRTYSNIYLPLTLIIAVCVHSTPIDNGLVPHKILLSTPAPLTQAAITTPSSGEQLCANTRTHGAQTWCAKLARATISS